MSNKDMDDDRRAEVEDVIGKGMVDKLWKYFSGVFSHLFGYLSLGKPLLEACI